MTVWEQETNKRLEAGVHRVSDTSGGSHKANTTRGGGSDRGGGWWGDELGDWD